VALFASATPLSGIEHQKPGTADTAAAYIYQAFNCLPGFPDPGIELPLS